MSKDSTSKFTSANDYQIDNRLWLSDINLEQRSVFEQYQTYIANSQYDEALALLDANQDVFAFDAWFFELLKNRIYNIADYVTNKLWYEEEPGDFEPNREPICFYHEHETSIRPLNVTIDGDTYCGGHWIGGKNSFTSDLSIHIMRCNNGKVVPNTSFGVAGDTITLTFIPDGGYQYCKVIINDPYVVDKNGQFTLGTQDAYLYVYFASTPFYGDYVVTTAKQVPDLDENEVWVQTTFDASNVSNGTIISNTTPTGVTQGAQWIQA